MARVALRRIGPGGTLAGLHTTVGSNPWRNAVPQIAPCMSHLERRRLECGATRDILSESGVWRRRQ
jgi:hypothetical protein